MANAFAGTVGGKQLGLKLPGGSGCYKGQKVGSGSPTLEGPKLGGPKSEGR